MRIALSVFLVGHAAVHAVMWTLPFTDATSDMPFDPADSWLLGHRPWLAVGVAGAAAAGFLAAAAGLALQTSWWPPVLAVAAVVSLLLMGLYWTAYWSVGIALGVGLAVYAVLAEPA